MPTLKNELKRVSRLSFVFAIDIMRLYESLDEGMKIKYAAKQMVRYGTQIGAKIAWCRSVGGYGFVPFFGRACRRAENAVFWLNAVYELGYISQAAYLENQMLLQSLKNAMDTILKKAVLQKAILKVGKIEIINEKLLNYN
jgi:four helix bundle protein